MPCSICKSIGTNVRTCPLNPQAIVVNMKKHPLAKQMLIKQISSIRDEKSSIKPVKIKKVKKYSIKAVKKSKSCAVIKPVVKRVPLSSLSNHYVCDEMTSFNLHDDFFKDISVRKNFIYYKGKLALLTNKILITSGGSGNVYKYTINSGNENFNIAIKTSKSSNKLDELDVIDKYPAALTCNGIISMIKTDTGDIIMPLASGDLTYFVKVVTFNQALEIIYQIGIQLLCLSKKHIHYYDVKLANIVYFCRKDGEIDISLADIGSIIPYYNSYVATYPPPQHHHGLVPILLNTYEERYYTYLLINLFVLLLVNDGLPSWDANQTVYNSEFLSSIKRVIKNLLLIDMVTESTPIIQYLSNMHDIGPIETAILNLPPLNEFLEMLNSMTI